MRILDSKAAENGGLKAFHGLRLVILSMIEAQKVQEAVENQMGHVIFELQAPLPGFPANGFEGKDYVTQGWRKTGMFRKGRK